MKNCIEIIKKHALKHPYILQAEICLVSSLLVAIPLSLLSVFDELKYKITLGKALGVYLTSMLACMIIYSILIYPIIVTLYEIILFSISLMKGKIKQYDDYLSKNAVPGMLYDFFMIFTGVVLEAVILNLVHTVDFSAQWYVQLHNEQLHTPLNSEHMVTFVVILLLYVLGMLFLTLTKGKKRPPLATVLCISAMYIGILEAVLFTIHILGMHHAMENGKMHSEFGPDLLYTLLIPVNMILITLRVILSEIRKYEPDENRQSKIERIPALRWCSRMLNNSRNWPIVALVMMIPLLGIVIGILTLFGQAPDAAIKAFTETADYTFSTKIPPQNIYYDEHYLCTVAAGGHKKIVKPIRMGKRHGHDVVVNRQLMIANAFEQILEERTPKMHRVIRNIYDKYGFPIARLIKSKIVADIVWVAMKPLEWFFLVVIYLLEVNPEDRIARQYL